MPVRRLYIGGLSQEIDGATLGSKLARYGAVEDIDMKEKSDLDGNVVQRFAYVNIEAHPSQLEECIKQLNGASWLGSQLRVEPAKESFLDRLKREQASRYENQASAPRYQNQGRASDYRNQGRDSQYQNQIRPAQCQIQQSISQDKFNRRDVSAPSSNDVKISNAKIEEKKTKKKKERKVSEQFQEEESGFEVEPEPIKKKKKKRKTSLSDNETSVSETVLVSKSKKNKGEEEILSSFKSYSSVWGDSDSEEVEPPRKSWKESHTGNLKKTKNKSVVHKTKASKAVTVESSSKSDAPADVDAPARNCMDIVEEHRAQLAILDKLENLTSQEQPVEDEPTAQNTTAEKEQKPDEENMYVHVAKDLKFGQTSGFSLLAQFSQQREEEFVEEKEAAPVMMPIQPWTPAERQEKKRSFFVAADDILIKSAIEWMAQSVTDAVVREFSEVQPKLRELFRTRATTIKRDLVDRGRGRGRKRGRGFGDRRNMSSGDKGRVTFSRDDRWRERGEETKRPENAVK